MQKKVLEKILEEIVYQQFNIENIEFFKIRCYVYIFILG